MYITVNGFIAVLFIVAFIMLVLGYYLGKETVNNWHHCHDATPPKHGAIVNYPVAFFDDEFGVVVDQAEYHPYRAAQWVTVPNGDPCKPFAWYDLPYPPWPRWIQHTDGGSTFDPYI